MKQCSQGENPLLLLAFYPTRAKSFKINVTLEIIKKFSTNKQGHHLGDKLHGKHILKSLKYILSWE